jgi:hypothetical protein
MVPRALPWAYMLRPRWGKSFALQADRAPPDVSRTLAAKAHAADATAVATATHVDVATFLVRPLEVYG